MDLDMEAAKLLEAHSEVITEKPQPTTMTEEETEAAKLLEAHPEVITDENPQPSTKITTTTEEEVKMEDPAELKTPPLSPEKVTSAGRNGRRSTFGRGQRLSRASAAFGNSGEDMNQLLWQEDLPIEDRMGILLRGSVNSALKEMQSDEGDQDYFPAFSNLATKSIMKVHQEKAEEGKFQRIQLKPEANEAVQDMKKYVSRLQTEKDTFKKMRSERKATCNMTRKCLHKAISGEIVMGPEDHIVLDPEMKKFMEDCPDYSKMRSELEMMKRKLTFRELEQEQLVKMNRAVVQDTLEKMEEVIDSKFLNWTPQTITVILQEQWPVASEDLMAE